MYHLWAEALKIPRELSSSLPLCGALEGTRTFIMQADCHHCLAGAFPEGHVMRAGSAEVRNKPLSSWGLDITTAMPSLT